MTHPKAKAQARLTPSEEFIQRYSRVERETDVLGRLIGVHKLKPSQQTKVTEMTPGLDGDADMRVLDEKTGEEKTIKVSRRFNMIMAASVCEIDGVTFPFAKTRGELDAVYDKLDNEGLEAAMIAYARMFPAKEDGEEEASDVMDEAKK